MRAGMQIGPVLDVRVNVTPSLANLSRFGVFTLLLPENPTESPRCWSGKMNTMLGFWGNACSFDNCLFFDVTLVTNLIRDILNIIQYMDSFERVGWKEGVLTLLESKSDLRKFCVAAVTIYKLETF